MKSFSCFLYPLTKYLVYRHRDIVGLLFITINIFIPINIFITINIVAGYGLNMQRDREVPGL